MQHANDSTLQTALSASSIVLVEFWAPWCVACRSMEPLLQQLERRHPEVTVVKVNGDENPGLMNRYGIRALPTLVVFHRGQLAGHHAGNPGSLSGLEGVVGLR